MCAYPWYYYTQSYALGDDVMILMGCDFEYENAAEWFTNQDKLIRAVNVGSSTHGVTVRYSSPEVYIDAKHAAGLAWPVIITHFLSSLPPPTVISRISY